MKQNFYDRFSLRISLKEWQSKFVNRIREMVFDALEKNTYEYSTYGFNEIFKFVCARLWIESNWYIQSWYNPWLYNPWLCSNKYPGWIKKISWYDFIKTIQILEILAIPCNEKLDNKIKIVLNLSKNTDGINLWINYHQWFFYPSWNEELDENIIEKSLDNLHWYKAEEYFHNALQKFLSWDKKWVNVACFETIEKLTQEILWNKKWLKENKKELQKMVNEWWLFSEYWSKIIENLYWYFCDSRHTRNDIKNKNLDDIEVEATLYQTGLVSNLIIQKSIPKKWKQ